MSDIKQVIMGFVQSFSTNPEQAAEAICQKIKNYGLSVKDSQGQTIPKDAILITYGDQISDANGKLSPLQAQRQWLNQHLDGSLSTVHILPFYPYSSDDGFSVIDYKAVQAGFGNWDDINALGNDYTLMFDAVVNHCSQEHQWFKDFLADKNYCQDYFIEVNPDNPALKKVMRPRTSPLVHAYETTAGVRYVWTTFSRDQIDLNFASPNLLAEMIDVLFFYIQNGARYIRLDAITFAIKKLGTNCATLPETHDLVKLIRYILSLYAPDVTLITETNVPHKENISYFNEGHEAQMVYNFPLPPLLIHAILRQNAEYLAAWAQKLEQDTPNGCAYFNMTATHDGIGIRGASAELGMDEINYMGTECKKRGGQILERTNNAGVSETYELNITFFDMLTPKDSPIDEAAIRRFMLSQYFVLAFKGVPAIYFHNLFASASWQKGYEQTQSPRTLNRKKYTNTELDYLLDSDSKSQTVFAMLKQALKLYQNIDVFGPYPKQEINLVETNLLQIIRGDNDKQITAYFNFSDNEKSIPLTETYKDLLTDKILTHTAQLSSWGVCWLMKEGA